MAHERDKSLGWSVAVTLNSEAFCGEWYMHEKASLTVHDYSSICLETNAGVLANTTPNSSLSAHPLFCSLLRMTAQPDYCERPLAFRLDRRVQSLEDHRPNAVSQRYKNSNAINGVNIV